MTLKEFFDRYGPTLAVLGVLGLLAVLLPGNARNDSAGTELGVAANTAGPAGATGSETAAGGSDTTATGSEGTLTAGGGTGAGTTSGSSTAGGGGGAGSGGGGTVRAGGGINAPAPAGGVSFGSGPNCRPDGGQNGFATLAPPCADWKKGTPNGGATAQGVTGDKILVIRFRPQTSAATQAALTGAGATDSREDTERQYQSLTRYFNLHYETYGREVVLRTYDASGPSDNEEAIRSDAIRIASELKAFAVLNMPDVGAAELARRGVLCMCTTSLSRTFYNALPPYIFSTLPTGELYYTHTAEYIGKRLANRPAKYAGDAAMKTQTRKFGLIWYEGVGSRPEPGYKASRDFFVRELAKYGVKLSAEFAFLFDIPKAGEQSAAMIAKMKSAGVTDVILSMDPLYPIFITQEATKQNYNPEWLIMGTALTDTTFFGRTYDKKQMQAAFGISPLYVFWEDFRKSPGFKEYLHVDPNAPGGHSSDRKVAINVNRASLVHLFTGIQMAGPKLTADSFARGLFTLPPRGGTPANPLLAYSRQDPQSYKDFTEIYWDSTFRGKDEVNKDGVGAFLKVDGGRRFQAGQWPSTEPKVFTREGAVFTSDNPAGGSIIQPHDADGHTHPPSQRCLSC